MATRHRPFKPALRNAALAAFMAPLALGLAGCNAKKPDKANFTHALKVWLAKQPGLCVSLPGKTVPFSVFEERWKRDPDTLVNAGLLTSKPAEKLNNKTGQVEKGTQYDLTALGNHYFVPSNPKQFFDPNQLCAGRFDDVTIDSFTQPSDLMGLTVSQVRFHYKVKHPAAWAEDANVRDNWPDFEDQAKEGLEGEETLVLTPKGWVDED
ncbi:hypothetical protein E3E12_00125 [Formicincola oecophyllae]|uniref:Lipoprotein n=1 Tax=Formicincola oecophyllae TaxID=2558361 RepID=A0A4Y6U9Q5_9PROT|nr:hypothetical protein [Formicincola oecophyllae]QDH12875.1 hypothetical protein E3E12_00125 [Formicincola oecophyllae]